MSERNRVEQNENTGVESETDGSEIVGHTIIAEGVEPNNYECYAVLTGDAKDDRSLMEPGTVFEIDEEEGSRCFGIVQESRRLSERDVIAEELSRQGDQRRNPLTSTLIKLRTFRDTGLSSPVGRYNLTQADEEGIRVAYSMPDEGIPIGLYTLPSGVPEQTSIVRIPHDYLLGPETAHMNIGGKQGYGKTSMGLVASKSLLTYE